MRRWGGRCAALKLEHVVLAEAREEVDGDLLGGPVFMQVIDTVLLYKRGAKYANKKLMVICLVALCLYT